MLRFWKTSAAATAIRQEVGRLDDDGDNFEISDTHDHVRKFSETNYWGLLLEEGTDYSVESGVVTLSAALTANETVVAVSAGEYIFEGQNVKGNSSVESDRTMEQQLWIQADGVNATEVEVTVGDYLAGHGLQATHFFLAADNAGNPDAYGAGGVALELGDIDDADIVPFWVKVIVPLGTAMDNYHDVHLTAHSVEFSTHE